MSGAMGGSASEEFLAPIEAGEDTYVRCSQCDYAANVEAVRVPIPPDQPFDDVPAAEVLDTPETPTIATLVDLLNARSDLRRPDREWAASDTLKNVIVWLRQPDGSREALAIGVPGDRDVDEKRLEAQVLPAQVEPFTDADFAARRDLVKGYIGPDALGSGAPSGIRFVVDPRIVTGTRWVTGANSPGRHAANVVAGRDFVPDGVLDVADVRPGDACPACGSPIEIARGVEMGHIFQLGRLYAEALGLRVIGPDGQLVTVTMGSYGIGVSRAVAAIAETTLDDFGLCWPRQVAPADVHVVIAGKPGAEQWPAAEALAGELEAAGLRVLLDDRDSVSPGVKFKDADLIGVPTIVVVGRGITDGLDRGQGPPERQPARRPVVQRRGRAGRDLPDVTHPSV